jgi:hypothetical protein
MAAFALPELLPNKGRHIGVVIADAVIYITVIVAPVTARYGFQLGTRQWIYWSMAILQFLSFLGLVFLYFPPANTYVESKSLEIRLYADQSTALEHPYRKHYED